MNLYYIILTPFATAVFAMLLKEVLHIKWLTLAGSLLQLMLAIGLTSIYLLSRKAGITDSFLFSINEIWYHPFNIRLHLGADGTAVSMILLTSMVVVAGVLVSWQMEERAKEYFVLLQLLSAGAYGFFLSLDLFTMFFFLEMAVVPKFLLITLWGSGNNKASAMKLALMLMAGSAFLFTGMAILYLQTPLVNGMHSFDIMELAKAVADKTNIQQQAFPFLFIGFGFFAALFPFHTWVPDGHASAPTAGSMFLAGISMKLGGFGCLRVAALLLPHAAQVYSGWIVTAATIAILYGSFATMLQTDLKFMNAYSSVSHCGFVILGIGMLNKTAQTGAVMQMVSHGLMTALFFAVIGIIYQRTHTRKMNELGGLLKVMPFTAALFAIVGLCSLGLPGLSGFAAEITVLVGAWQRNEHFFRWATILAASSIVVTAVYILRAMGKVIMGTAKAQFEQLTDAVFTEKIAASLLLTGILIIGIVPMLLVKLIEN